MVKTISVSGFFWYLETKLRLCIIHIQHYHFDLPTISQNPGFGVVQGPTVAYNKGYIYIDIALQQLCTPN